jgi:hypothetical protein
VHCHPNPRCTPWNKGKLIGQASTAGILLFDHLVGAAEKRDWKGEAERLRGLEIDGQLDFRGLMDR